MANIFFSFKQFTVFQENCAMKVGTDGVLLGAWVDSDGKHRVLDVGAGTGLISLMIAQREPRVVIDALEIDHLAAVTAQVNFNLSPWGDRISCIEDSFNTFLGDCHVKYDLIVSNPPYFENSVKAECEKRTIARHTDLLSFEELIRGAAQLLSLEGVLAMIYPIEADLKIQSLAQAAGFHCKRRTWVKGTETSAVKRVLAEFSNGILDAEIVESVLTIEMARHQYTEEYKELTRAFYLKM